VKIQNNHVDSLFIGNALHISKAPADMFVIAPIKRKRTSILQTSIFSDGFQLQFHLETCLQLKNPFCQNADSEKKKRKNKTTVRGISVFVCVESQIKPIMVRVHQMLLC